MARFEARARCRSCKGTGLYVGIAERDGSAVVCHTCKGTGCETIRVDYEPFAGKLAVSGVSRVFEVNPGIVIGNGPGGKFSLEDFGGQPLVDWLNGTPFPRQSENRAFTCPAWWYQSADYSKKPEWDECTGCGSFSSCKHFGAKEKCWERFDAEQLVQIEATP